MAVERISDLMSEKVREREKDLEKEMPFVSNNFYKFV